MGQFEWYSPARCTGPRWSAPLVSARKAGLVPGLGFGSALGFHFGVELAEACSPMAKICRILKSLEYLRIEPRMVRCLQYLARVHSKSTFCERSRVRGEGAYSTPETERPTCL